MVHVGKLLGTTLVGITRSLDRAFQTSGNNGKPIIGPIDKHIALGIKYLAWAKLVWAWITTQKFVLFLMPIRTWLNRFPLGSFKRYIRWGGEGGSLRTKQKRLRGRGSYHVCTFAFFKENAEIFKMKFYSYSPVFPIDYNGSIKY